MTAEDERTNALIAENIARARGKHGLSQAGLAAAMSARGHTHWRQNTVSRIERGEQSLTIPELQGLLAVLQGEDLLDGIQLDPGRAWDQMLERMFFRGRLEAIEAALTQSLGQVRELRAALGGDDAQR